MDDALNGAERAPSARFGPDRRLTALAAVAALVVAVAALVSNDPEGRLLLVGAALVLGGYAVTDLVFSPRITATTTELVLNSPFARARLRWHEVDSVHAHSRHRLGVTGTTLEIEAGDLVAILTRRALGADPEDVATRLLAFARAA